jgi:hypothetical protein
VVPHLLALGNSLLGFDLYSWNHAVFVTSSCRSRGPDRPTALGGGFSKPAVSP